MDLSRTVGQSQQHHIEIEWPTYSFLDLRLNSGQYHASRNLTVAHDGFLVLGIILSVIRFVPDSGWR